MSFLALFRKELQGYFVSPILYITAGVFLGLCGFFFYSWLVYFVQYGFGIDILGNLWMAFLTGAPYSVSSVLLLVVPLLTMRLFAEERKLGTIELLLTYPLTDSVILAAKFAACATVLALMLAGTLLYPAYVATLQPLPWAPVLVGYGGLYLLGLSFVACGIFVSSLTENQVVAAVGTLGILVLFWMATWNESAVQADLLRPLARLSMFDRFQNFARGVIDVDDVFYFLGFTVFFNGLTLRVLESRKWRG